MINFIYLYFVISSFIAGYTLANFDFITCVFMLLFGPPIIIIWYIILFAKYISATFQLSFWFDWIILRKSYKMDKDTLLEMNRLASRRNNNWISNKIYNYGLSLINKRNNFVYTEDKEK